MNPKHGLFGRPDDEPSPKVQELIERLRSIMAAAADEIEEHWAAHCDKDGFGPVSLVRRLRTGVGDYRQQRSDDVPDTLDVVSLEELAERCRSLDLQARADGSWSLLMQVDGVSHLIRLHDSNLARLLRRALDVSGDSLAAVLEDEADELARELLSACSTLARVRGEPWPEDGTEGLDAWLSARGVRGYL